MTDVHEPKTCASCGRSIEWRKKWERDWDAVRFCSDACRKRKVTDEDRRLEGTILELLAARAAPARGPIRIRRVGSPGR